MLLHNIVLHDNVYNTWRWLLDPIHGYSVRGSYCFLTSTVIWWTELWLMMSGINTSKVSLLAWRLLRNRLPTKDNLVHCGILPSNYMACVDGCASTESTTHLCLHCTFSWELWSYVWNWLGISSVSTSELRRHFTQFTKMASMPIFSHLFFKIIWLFGLQLIGWFGRRRTTRYFKTRYPLLFLSLKK